MGWTNKQNKKQTKNKQTFSYETMLRQFFDTESSEMLTQNRQKCWHRIVRRWWSNAHLWSVLELGRGLDQSVPLSDIACLYRPICELLLWFHSRLDFLLSTVFQDICCTQMHLLCCIEWHVSKFQMLWEKLFLKLLQPCPLPFLINSKCFCLW